MIGFADESSNVETDWQLSMQKRDSVIAFDDDAQKIISVLGCP